MGEILFTVMFFVILLLLLDRKVTHDDLKDQKLKDEDPLGYRTRERLKEKLRQTTLIRWNQDTEEDFNLSKQHQQNVEKTESLDDIHIHHIKKDDIETPNVVNNNIKENKVGEYRNKVLGVNQEKKNETNLDLNKTFLTEKEILDRKLLKKDKYGIVDLKIKEVRVLGRTRTLYHTEKGVLEEDEVRKLFGLDKLNSLFLEEKYEEEYMVKFITEDNIIEVKSSEYGYTTFSTCYRIDGGKWNKEYQYSDYLLKVIEVLNRKFFYVLDEECNIVYGYKRRDENSSGIDDIHKHFKTMKWRIYDEYGNTIYD